MNKNVSIISVPDSNTHISAFAVYGVTQRRNYSQCRQVIIHLEYILLLIKTEVVFISDCISRARTRLCAVCFVLLPERSSV